MDDEKYLSDRLAKIEKFVEEYSTKEAARVEVIHQIDKNVALILQKQEDYHHRLRNNEQVTAGNTVLLNNLKLRVYVMSAILASVISSIKPLLDLIK